MIKKSVSLIVLSITLATFANAQTSDSSSVKKVKRHEIGVNLTPIFGLYSEGQSGGIIFPLFFSYKFSFKESKLRVNYYSSHITNFEYVDNGAFSDTSLNYYSNNDNESNYKIGIGLEFNKTTEWLEFVFANDLVMGFQQRDKFNSAYRKLNMGEDGEYTYGNL